MPKALTPTDDAVFTLWIADNWRNPNRQRREAAIICSLMRCSLRAIEVARINADSVDVDNVLHVPTAKGGIRRLLQLTAGHADAIDGTPTIFGRTTAAYQHIASTTLRRVLGTKQYSGHSLRHTAAIDAYERTRDIYAVAVLLGHRNVASTVHYLRTILETPTSLLPNWQSPRPYAINAGHAPPFDAIPSDRRERHNIDKQMIRTAARAAVREYQLQQRKTNSVAATIAARIASESDLASARIAMHNTVDLAFARESRRRGARTIRKVAQDTGVANPTAARWCAAIDTERRARINSKPWRKHASEPV